MHVQIRQSPYYDKFYGHHTARITLDSGAEGNLIRESTAGSPGVKIRKSSQSTHQADWLITVDCCGGNDHPIHS